MQDAAKGNTLNSYPVKATDKPSKFNKLYMSRPLISDGFLTNHNGRTGSFKSPSAESPGKQLVLLVLESEE